jgi:hypothetical protein
MQQSKTEGTRADGPGILHKQHSTGLNCKLAQLVVSLHIPAPTRTLATPTHQVACTTVKVSCNKVESKCGRKLSGSHTGTAHHWV